jgi:hypothetical protein
MKDKEIEDLLRQTWRPKPPPELKQRALSAAQATPQDRSPMRRFALRAGIALATTAAAACIVLVLIHPGAPGLSTRTTSAPPARIAKRFASPIAKTRPIAPFRDLRTKPTPIAAAKTLSHKPRRQIALRPDASAGARVSYVDADKFDTAQAEVPAYTSATIHAEPDGGPTPEARVAYTRPGVVDRLRMTSRTPAGARILSPEMEDMR